MKKIFIFSVACLTFTIFANNGNGNGNQNGQQPMPNQKTKVSAQQPVIYIPESAQESVRYGLDNTALLAQYPELALTDADGNVLAINYVALIPILVQQIQQLQTQVQQLLNQNQQ